MKKQIVYVLAGMTLLGTSTVFAARAHETVDATAAEAGASAASSQIMRQATEIADLMSAGFINVSKVIGGQVPANMVGLNTKDASALADLAQAIKSQPLAYTTLKGIAVRLQNLKTDSKQDVGVSLTNLAGKVYAAVLVLARANVRSVTTDTGVDFVDASNTLNGISDEARSTLRALNDLVFDQVVARSFDELITGQKDDQAAIGALGTVSELLTEITSKAQGLALGDIKGLAAITLEVMKPRAEAAGKSVAVWANDLTYACGNNGKGKRA